MKFCRRLKAQLDEIIELLKDIRQALRAKQPARIAMIFGEPKHK